MAHLDDGLDPRLSRRALGDDERADRLDGPVAGLRVALGLAGQRRACRLDRVEGVGLARVAACLAVRSVDLDDVDVLAAKEPREPRAIGARALDADLGDLAEPRSHVEERSIASCVGREGLGADEPAERVEGSGDVDVEVRVDAPGDAWRCFYDGHGHPFLP